jgi:predicted enzyme related to lactoylglutathione lyase
MKPSNMAENRLEAGHSAVKHVAFFVYPVRDIGVAREFYEGVLGLKLERNTEEHWLEYNIQGTTLAITDWLENAQPCANGPSLALEVAHAESLIQFFQLNRVNILRPMFETPDCYMAVVADPDGNALIIHQSKTLP